MQNNVNVVVVGYDLCPAVSMTQISEELREAMAYIWTESEALGINCNRLNVMGHSAGGHLTQMMMATDWSAYHAAMPRDMIKAGIPVSPLSYLEPVRLTLALNTNFMVIPCFAAIFFEHSWSAVGSLDISNMGLLLIYACLALGLSQVFWIKAVGEVGIGVASFHLNATPFYVMIIIFILGSEWNWMQALGAVILTVGTVMAQLPEKRSGHERAHQL